MASGTVAPQTMCEGPPLAPTRYATFIEGRIHYTRRQVKTVDVATGLMVLAAGTLVFLLAVAVLDHWVVAGGLGFSSRLLLWLAGVAAAGTYFWLQVLPPLLYRINPIYAAQTIEQNRPTLKNSLINFLMLRGHREEVLPVVYHALEQRAAVDLSQTNIEAAVDRGSVVRRACLLAGVVVACALYLALSPKNPLTSAARVLWPWSRIAAPTRVTIEDLRPGDAQAFLGDSVEVSALVGGLGDGESVTLFASTADGQSVDQPIAMNPIGEGNRFQCTLPPGNLGLQQDMLYRLAAGDCSTPEFRIEVQIAPSILVDRVDYHYPPYTGQKDGPVRGQGDIRAIEGTRVTLYATANQEIRAAKIDLNCAGLRSLAMQSEGQTATGQFTLGFAADGRPLFDSYQILFSDSQGRTNRRPVRYRVEVIRDLPPEVQILSPKEEDVSVPLNGKVAIGVRAEDADFALRKVAVTAEREGRRLSIPLLLNRKPPEPPLQGVFQKEYVFQPAALGLKAGDRIKYWAEADDNKEPTSNHVETPARTLRVTAPDGAPTAAAGDQPHRAPRPPQDGQNPQQDPQKSTSPRPKAEQGTAEQSPESPSEKQPNSAEQKPEGEKPTSPESKKPDGSQGPQDGTQNESGAGSQAGSSSSGDNTEKQDQPGSPNGDGQQKIDPATQPADAFNKISQHLEKQGEKDQQESKSGNAGESGDKGSSAGSQKPDPSKSGNAGESGDKGSSAGSQKPDPSKSGNAGESGDKGSSAGSQKPDPSKSGNAGESGDKGSSAGSQKPDPSKSGNAGESGDKGSSAGSQKPDPSKSGNAGESGDKGSSAGSQKPDPSKSGNAGESGDKGSSAGSQKPDPSKSGNAGESGDKGSSAGSQKPDPSKSGNAGESGDKGSSAGSQKPDPSKSGSAGKSGDKGSSAGQQKTGQKPEAGEKSGGQEAGTQKPGEGKQSNDGQSSPQKGGSTKGGANKGGIEDASSRQQDPSKSGNDALGNQGPPSPHGEKLPGEQKTAEGSPNPQSPQNDAQSPSTTPKDSTAKGDSDGGDRSGRGGKGGDQAGKKAGKGASGANTPSEQGGSVANEKGPGETGSHAGDQVKGKDLTGQAKQEPGLGEGQRREEPGAKGPLGKSEQTPNESADSTAAPNEPSNGGLAGNNTSDKPGSRGAGPPTTGGRPGQLEDVPANPNAPDRGEDAANLDFTRKQVDLALEHLSDQLAKEKPDLLKDLGWNRDEAQRFLENWNKLKAAAKESGAQGDRARKSLDEALRNLGLRPHATRMKGSRTTTDQIRDLRDAGQFDPPNEWQDAVGAYSRTLGQRRAEK